MENRCLSDIGKLLQAVDFAAKKHRYQKRKGIDRTPYINHPVAVARILCENGNIEDIDVLMAAVLHDTVEDTDTTPRELKEKFGEKVMSLVMEVTDDKTLPKQRRKEIQVETAAAKTYNARMIKLADKIHNIRDIAANPPGKWSVKRIKEYMDWAEEVINQIRGTHAALENLFDTILKEGREKYRE